MTPQPAVTPIPSRLEFQVYEADNETPVQVDGAPLAWTGTAEASAKFVLGDATIGTEAKFELPFDDPRWPHLISTPGRLVRVVRRRFTNEGPVDILCDALLPRIQGATPIPRKSENGAEPAVVLFSCVSRIAAMDGGLVELRPDTEPFAGATSKRLMSGWQLPECSTATWSDPEFGTFAYDPAPPLGFYSPFAQRITHPDAVAGETILVVIDFVPGRPIVIPRFAATGSARCWLQGVPIGETPAGPSDSKAKCFRWPILSDPTATYRLAFEIKGTDTARPELLCEMYAVDSMETGRLNTASFLFQTGNLPDGPDGDEDPDPAPWKVYRVTDSTRPGLTAGQMAAIHLAEQQADGVHTATTLHFGEGFDSALEPWPVVQNFITDTLKTTPEYFSQLAASEWDMWPARDSNQLLAVGWRQRGTYHLDPVDAPKFVGGQDGLYAVDDDVEGNLTELSWERTLVPEEVRYRIRCSDGYVLVGPDGAPKRGVDFGDIDRDAARALGGAMATARTDQAITYTLQVHETDEDHWFDPEHIWLGDAIATPSGPTASWENQRVNSVAYKVDGAGNVITLVELSSRQIEAQAQLDRRIARVRAGVSSESITAPDRFGIDVEGGEVREYKLPFSSRSDDAVEDLAEWSDMNVFPPGRWKMFRFHARAADAPVSYIGWDFTLNRTPFHSAALEAGEKETLPQDGWIGDHIGEWRDQLHIQWTERGEGCKGFSCDVFYAEWF